MTSNGVTVNSELKGRLNTKLDYNHGCIRLFQSKLAFSLLLLFYLKN